jgi:hypothetical protein
VITHSFVDESKGASYLLVAALIQPPHLALIRKAIEEMVLPRQRRIHFYQERDSRRSQIMVVWPSCRSRPSSSN